MRLICPNCGAQYEVDVGVIPEAGRDVQCSNCGHTWYQRGEPKPETVVPPKVVKPEKTVEKAEPAEISPEEPEQPVSTETDEPVSVAQDDSADETADAIEPDVEAEPAKDDVVETAEASPPAPDETPADVEHKRRALSDSVTGILQEEAAREVAERQSRRSSLETQTELGLETQQSEDEIKRRMERLRSDDEDLGESIAVAATAAASNRRDLLPDIEEINSTLEASGDASQSDEDEKASISSGGGFRRGFTMVLILFALCLAVYVLAGTIIQYVPQAEPVLRAYVEIVNALLASVDSLLQKGVDRLTVIISQFGT